MIFCKNISKSFGSQTLFSEADFAIHPGEKVGLIGRNGSGKSTLLQLILGKDSPDEGEIKSPEKYNIGSLSQEIHFEKNQILSQVTQNLPSHQKYDTWRGEKILTGLGFSPSDFDRAPQEFSGGFQTRIKLAELLVSSPDLLILDEPTNYLDITSIRWLESFLKDWKSEILCVSHDPTFLTHVTTHTALVHRQKIRKIKGTPQKLYKQIQQEEIIHEKTRLNEEKEKSRQEKFIREFRSGARSAGLVQSRIKMLEKRESLKPLPLIPPITFSFPEKSFSSARVGEARRLHFAYPSGPELLGGLDLEIRPGEKIGIIGPNGKGKTTLLKIFDQRLEPTSGTLKYNQNISKGYFGQSNTLELSPEKSILQELTLNKETSEQTVRNIAGQLLFEQDQAQKKIRILSGGEKSRVCLGKLLIKPTNFLLLDEPTNHLDYESVEALIDALQKYSHSVLFVTHDEYFLEKVAEKLIVFDQEKVFLYYGKYKDFIREKGFSQDLSLDKKEEKKEKKAPVSREKQKEYQRLIRPLLKKLEIGEKEIEILEKEKKEQEKNLQKAKTKGNLVQMDMIAEDLSKIEKKLFPLLEKWEETGKKLEEIQKKFKDE